MKKFELIPIAKKKVERRQIPDEWIKETIDSPDQTVSGYSGRSVAQKKYTKEGKEYLLGVVYEEKEGSFTVLTAYLTSQVARYWEEEKNED